MSVVNEHLLFVWKHEIIFSDGFGTGFLFCWGGFFFLYFGGVFLKIRKIKKIMADSRQMHLCRFNSISIKTCFDCNVVINCWTSRMDAFMIRECHRCLAITLVKGIQMYIHVWVEQWVWQLTQQSHEDRM